MKKNINFVYKCLIALLFLILPIVSNAKEYKTDYLNIYGVEYFTLGNFFFDNVSLRDYSESSTLSFGLTGDITNNHGKNIDYLSTIYYYDYNYNLIGESSKYQTAINGVSEFTHMSNLSILKGQEVNDIVYYIFKINYDVGNINENLKPSENISYNSLDYVIDKYDINVVLNENNTLDITETITAYFNVYKHGIIRNIPLKNTITRLDGTTSTNRVNVSNVRVDSEFETSKSNGNYVIKIGSPDYTLVGEKKYVIKYRYNLGKDPVKNYDELYFNIIGNEWDTVIGNVTFSISMPKEFDSSKLGFSSGSKGSTNNSNVRYTVSGNKIVGSYDGILGVGEGLTVRCELPEGYFVGAKSAISPLIYLMIGIPILGLVISLFLWYKYGRDDQVIETVEFYPPKDLNSLEVGYLYKGKAENNDVTSLLIYLANKGYIKISDGKINLESDKVNLSKNSKANQKIIEFQNKINEEKQNNSNSEKIKYYENMLNVYKDIDKPIDYKQYGLETTMKKSKKKQKTRIKKIKDYDGNSHVERLFMNGLFKYDRDEVTIGMLKNNFYKTNNKILKLTNNNENKEKVFEKVSLKSAKFVMVLMVISLITMIAIPTIDYGGLGELGITLVVLAIYFPFYWIGFFTKMSLLTRIFLLSFIFFHSSVFFSQLSIGKVLISDYMYLLAFIIGVICLGLMFVYYRLIPKRTQYGNEMLGKLKGFKNFLEVAEKEKLESMVMKNPNYFYDILPYTYVLGVSDKWIKKFETITLQPPEWYDSSSSFNASSFGTFINSTMNSAQKAMSSSPSSSGGGSSVGGSSGGGSSGGGSGGGGGSSW